MLVILKSFKPYVLRLNDLLQNKNLDKVVRVEFEDGEEFTFSYENEVSKEVKFNVRIILL